MKVLKIIKKVLVTVVLIIFFAFTITMTILLLNYNRYGLTQFEDTTLLIIKKNFASETYPKDSLVFVESKRVADYKVGEEVFVYHLDGTNSFNIELDTISQVYEKEDAILLKKGSTFSSQFIMGTGSKVIPNIGKILSVIESKWGFLFIILVPNFFIFIYQLYALIVRIKYDKDEE